MHVFGVLRPGDADLDPAIARRVRVLGEANGPGRPCAVRDAVEKAAVADSAAGVVEPVAAWAGAGAAAEEGAASAVGEYDGPGPSAGPVAVVVLVETGAEEHPLAAQGLPTHSTSRSKSGFSKHGSKISAPLAKQRQASARELLERLGVAVAGGLCEVADSRVAVCIPSPVVLHLG